MKYLHEYLSNQSDLGRIEKKFLLSKGSGLNANILLRRSLFCVDNPNRYVTSYYFDDFTFTALRDNINGNPFRDKLRVRWYNNDFESAQIEIKHKRNMFGFKTIFNLSSSSEPDLLAQAKKWVQNHIKEPLNVVSRISYRREYLKYGNVRATVDVNLRSHRYSRSGLIRSKNSSYDVVEFKYKPDEDFKVRKIFNSLEPFCIRATKSSKFANSLVDDNVNILSRRVFY